MCLGSAEIAAPEIEHDRRTLFPLPARPRRGHGEGAPGEAHRAPGGLPRPRRLRLFLPADRDGAQISLATVRREVDKALAERPIHAPERHASLQVARLTKALCHADFKLERVIFGPSRPT